jgi:outer membrane receptor for monomeric catechols
MALQTGNAGNITALDPTVIGVAESPAYNNSWNDNWHYRAAFSYITGSHQFKVGFNNASGHFENLNYDVNPIYYTFTSGVPTSITIKDSPYTVQVDVDRDLGFFVQDRWTLQRWSLYGGIRYDSFKNSFPAQDLLPSKYVPNRPVTHFAAQDNISWNDITPKLGASYDVFGNGKTAFKVSLNKYLLGYGTLGFFENGLSSNPHPINTLTTNTSIGWNDANHNLVPQCNLLNPACEWRMHRVGEPRLRLTGADHHLRSRSADRVGKAKLQLGVFRRCAARAPAARVAGRELLPPDLREFPDDRQPSALVG